MIRFCVGLLCTRVATVMCKEVKCHRRRFDGVFDLVSGNVGALVGIIRATKS